MTAKIKSVGSHGRERFKHKPRGLSDRAFAKVYWPYIPVVLIAGAILTFSAQAGALQAAMSKHHGRVLDYATSMSINNLLADTNSARAANGVGSLSINNQLDAAAQAQANDMAARNYWSHYTPQGQPPWIWVDAQNYSYQALGQNLAAGFNNEQATVDGWLASPEHRTNMLNPVYTDVGFASASNPNYTSAGGGPMTIVVAFYGEPTPSYTTPQAISTTPTASTPASTTTPTSSTPTSSPSDSGITLAYRTSRAQLAFAHLPEATFATSLVIIAGIVAIGLWVSRHVFAFRRAWVHGEEFVVRHPLIDVGLLTIAAASFLLSQTAGFIQ